MIWNTPSAFAALALVALPVLVHLLIRRHATRVVFPAMRFVPGVRAASVRLRAPSDRALLLVRMGIVAAAAVAAAQPVLTTAARQRAWQARVARAVIVDTSASMPAGAARLADEAAAGAFAVRRFASPDLHDAVRRAADWLASAPAFRHDITVVSDFQRGAIDAADFAPIPSTIGITLVRAGAPAPSGRMTPVDGWRGGRWDAAIRLDSVTTGVTWTHDGAAPPGGLTVRAPAADRAAAERAEAAARSFGVPVADPVRRVDVAFAGAEALAKSPPQTPWIVAAALALHSSPLVVETATAVQVGERDGVMTVKAETPATSAYAPAVIRAALLASAPRIADPEGESAVVDERTLARWHRDASPSGLAAPRTEDSDGRWLWMLALALLAVEDLVRRRASAGEREIGSSALPAAGGKHADAA